MQLNEVEISGVPRSSLQGFLWTRSSIRETTVLALDSPHVAVLLDLLYYLRSYY